MDHSLYVDARGRELVLEAPQLLCIYYPLRRYYDAARGAYLQLVLEPGTLYHGVAVGVANVHVYERVVGLYSPDCYQLLAGPGVSYPPPCAPVLLVQF